MFLQYAKSGYALRNERIRLIGRIRLAAGLCDLVGDLGTDKGDGQQLFQGYLTSGICYTARRGQRRKGHGAYPIITSSLPVQCVDSSGGSAWKPTLMAVKVNLTSEQRCRYGPANTFHEYARPRHCPAAPKPNHRDPRLLVLSLRLDMYSLQSLAMQ